MASSPDLKIYNPSGEYVASCKFAEDAAAIVALYGAGAKIRWHHTNLILWHEGKEERPASESYDFVGTVVLERIGKYSRADAIAKAMQDPALLKQQAE